MHAPACALWLRIQIQPKPKRGETASLTEVPRHQKCSSSFSLTWHFFFIRRILKSFYIYKSFGFQTRLPFMVRWGNGHHKWIPIWTHERDHLWQMSPWLVLKTRPSAQPRLPACPVGPHPQDGMMSPTHVCLSLWTSSDSKRVDPCHESWDSLPFPPF